MTKGLTHGPHPYRQPTRLTGAGLPWEAQTFLLSSLAAFARATGSSTEGRDELMNARLIPERMEEAV